MVRVMIVDDDQLLHKVLDRILSLGGHDVVAHAFNGAEAVEKYIQSNPKPDLVLMDHRMPVMNGITATNEILANYPSARILFISADESIREDALKTGAVGFLTKPIRSKDLFAAIDKYIGK